MKTLGDAVGDDGKMEHCPHLGDPLVGTLAHDTVVTHTCSWQPLVDQRIFGWLLLPLRRHVFCGIGRQANTLLQGNEDEESRKQSVGGATPRKIEMSLRCTSERSRFATLSPLINLDRSGMSKYETATPGSKRTAIEAAKLGDVKGKTFVITGPYSGIGVETTKAILAEGGKVVLGGRNSEALDEFVDQMKKEYSDEAVDGYVIDLADLKSVQGFANYVQGKGYKDLVVICNAGVMNTPAGKTKDCFETQMGANVIGHFLLTKLLVAQTKRQVWVSSVAHSMVRIHKVLQSIAHFRTTALSQHNSPRVDIELIKKYKEKEGGDTLEGYDGWKAYQQSKLGNILISKEFAKRYPHIETASLHPGVIITKIQRHTGIWSTLLFLLARVPELARYKSWSGVLVAKSVQVGASTTVTAATTSSLENGAYYDDCAVGKETESAKNMDDASALFDYCDEVTKDLQ